MKPDKNEVGEEYPDTNPYMILAKAATAETILRFHVALAQDFVIRGILMPDESFLLFAELFRF